MNTPEDTDTPAPAPAPGAPPPAATLVLESGARESDAAEMVRLKREADEAKRLLKEREVEIAHVRDENHRLKTPPPAPAPAPAPQRERAPGWLDCYRTPDELTGAD